MVKNATPLICLSVLIMDVVAGILGIQAEIAQNKVHHLKVWIFECKDPSYQAFKLGLAAAVILAVAHVIGNLLGGCICISSKEDYQKATANKQLAIASLILSCLKSTLCRITLAVAFSLLIAGAMSNRKSRKSCGLSHHRVLSIGGILCFFHGLFIIAYYASAKATFKEGKPKPTTPSNPA
ncbi:protein DESIGUAL 2-like isoform X2 [Malus domestica]|uniref:protein DESIGUAL 2-like isoform X2 n=1 Tax=Malus domestica TaxID=3750 RepID=UPI0039759311